VYGLAILIAAFSGVWPYVKLLAMLFCWFAPTSILKVTKRQQFLNFLDAYGKWSLVDTFILVLFMVAFNFNLSVEDAPAFFADIFKKDLGSDVKITVIAEPEWSFHCFMLATLLSLVLGHVVTACHRYAHKVGEYGLAAEVSCSQKLRLCNIMRPEGFLRGKIFVYVPGLILVTSLILVIVGVLLDTFQFTFFGMAALALGPPERSVRPFSVISLASALPSASPEPDSFGTRWIQCTFILFSMVMVFVYHIILIILWWAPLTNKVQRHLLITSQILNAWSALDVFVVSIMAGVLEIQQFTKFIVGTKCDKLDALVAMTPIADKIPGGVKCFDVETELEGGFWILLVATVLSTVIGQLMVAKSSAALSQQQSRLSSFRESVTAA